MSTDSPTAAVPGPNDPTGAAPQAPAQGQAPGLLASMIAPVEPARPAAFTLDPGTAAEAGEAALEGASSAAYHGETDSTAATTAGGSTARQGCAQQGVIKAWLLAGATRWAKGGGTHNKRLDLAKAKAQANQVKETRTVNIKRSDAPAQKAALAPAGGGKSLNSKGNPNGPAKDPKNTNRNSPGSASGRGNPGSDAGAGSRDNSRSSAGPKPQANTGQSCRAPKPTKPDTSAPPAKAAKQDTPTSPKPPAPKSEGTGAGTGLANGGKGAPGTAGSTGKPGKDAPAPKPASPAPASPSAGSGNKAPVGKDDHAPDRMAGKDTSGKPVPSSTDRAASSSRDTAKGTGPGDKPENPGGPLKTTGDTKATKPTDGSKPDPEPTKDPAKDPGTGPAEPARQQPPTGSGKPFTTRDSREAGYRDGTRAARTVAHARAYRDGVKDGYRDTTEAAQRDKARLDAAHQERKKARDKEQPVPNTANSADYHQPQPVGVKDVTPSHVHLGHGAARESMTRGEVRSLKSFERRLEAKVETLTRIAEDTKGLKAHAEQQAKRATKLHEDAKAVKGGEKLTAALAKLAEAAKVQAAQADAIHKRAVRGAEAARVVLANAETRYGGIYQAVVDSDTTAPAELAFYKG